MQNRQAVIILSAQDLLSKPTSANHNLKFFPVIQCARPQLHKIEKAHYKWPEPLENCGNVASGCKALSCGKKILQLSINTVSLLRKSAHTLSFIKKGFHMGCSKLWMKMEQVSFLIILIYSFRPLLSYLMHQTLKRMRTQSTEINAQGQAATWHGGTITGFSRW